jgi:hypothetical protein
VLGGLRSVLGLIALIGGAVTTVLGVVALLGAVSFEAFFTSVGVAYLLLVGVTLLALISRSAPPTAERGEVAAKPSPSGAEVGAAYFLWLALAVIAIPSLGLVWLAGGTTVGELLQILGFWAIIWFGVVLYLQRRELAGVLRDLGRLSRACPRCGHAVPSGVMICPHCGFDFRTIGR